MIPGRRLPFPAAVFAAGLLGALVAPGPTLAGIPQPRITLHAVAGGVQPDPALAAQRWSASVRPALGAELNAGWHRLETGVRITTWSARQGIVLPGVETSVGVRALNVDAMLRLRTLSLSRFHLLASLHAGHLQLDYDPETLTLPTGGGAEATFHDIGTWVAGAGLALEARFGNGSVVGLEGDHTAFSLDTTSRDGDAVVTRREPYGSWSLWLRIGFTLPAPSPMETAS